MVRFATSSVVKMPGFSQVLWVSWRYCGQSPPPKGKVSACAAAARQVKTAQRKTAEIRDELAFMR